MKNLDEFEVELREVLAFAEKQKGPLSPQQNALIYQAIKGLNVLAGGNVPETFGQLEVENVAAKCDEILKQFKWLQ